MGPRIREDKRGGGLFGGKDRGWFETSPYGLRVSMSDGGGRGWVPASARTRGGECDNGDGRVRGTSGFERALWERMLRGMGFTPIPSTSLGQAPTFPHHGGRGLQVGEKMGPRMREDKRGGGLFGGKDRGWFETSPYGLRVSMSDEGRGWACVWDEWFRACPMGENVEENGIHPHPFDKLRAGSNLPPSRGKGFTGRGRWVPASARTRGWGVGRVARWAFYGNEIPRLGFAALGTTFG